MLIKHFPISNLSKFQQDGTACSNALFSAAAFSAAALSAAAVAAVCGVIPVCPGMFGGAICALTFTIGLNNPISTSRMNPVRSNLRLVGDFVVFRVKLFCDIVYIISNFQFPKSNQTIKLQFPIKSFSKLILIFVPWFVIGNLDFDIQSFTFVSCNHYYLSERTSLAEYITFLNHSYPRLSNFISKRVSIVFKIFFGEAMRFYAVINIFPKIPEL